MSPPDGASIAEAVVLTNLSEGTIRTLASGPFAFDRPDERLSLGHLTGIATLAALGLCETLPAKQAVGLAVEAAQGAELGGNRVLVVTWRGDQPCVTWADAVPTTLRQLFITIPVDAVATDLAGRLAALRQGSARPH
jgi:hypothetical protein